MISNPVLRKNAAPAAPVGLPASSPLRGILLLVASTVFFSVGDVITKQLALNLPAPEVAWMRYATFALLVIPFVLLKGGVAVLRSQRPGLQVARGFGMVGSSIMFIEGLRYLPVADATAIFFVSPILIMALSVLFLGESVGWRRWTAAAVGLIGVLIVVRPGTSAFHPAAVFPLLGALSWAVAVIATRKASASEHPITTLAYSAIVGMVILSILLPFSWITPTWREMGLGLALGLLSTAGHGLVVLAYRHAS